jgi:hypothetical protein
LADYDPRLHYFIPRIIDENPSRQSGKYRINYKIAAMMTSVGNVHAANLKNVRVCHPWKTAGRGLFSPRKYSQKLCYPQSLQRSLGEVSEMKGLEYMPARDGFEFSNAQIHAAIDRDQRLQRASTADFSKYKRRNFQTRAA